MTLSPRETDLVVPVVELLGTGLAAEVPRHAAELARDTSLAHLAAVVAADALEAQTLDEVLLEKQLATWTTKRSQDGARLN